MPKSYSQRIMMSRATPLVSHGRGAGHKSTWLEGGTMGSHCWAALAAQAGSLMWLPGTGAAWARSWLTWQAVLIYRQRLILT